MGRRPAAACCAVMSSGYDLHSHRTATCQRARLMPCCAGSMPAASSCGLRLVRWSSWHRREVDGQPKRAMLADSAGRLSTTFVSYRGLVVQALDWLTSQHAGTPLATGPSLMPFTNVSVIVLYSGRTTPGGHSYAAPSSTCSRRPRRCRRRSPKRRSLTSPGAPEQPGPRLEVASATLRPPPARRPAGFPRDAPAARAKKPSSVTARNVVNRMCFF